MNEYEVIPTEPYINKSFLFINCHFRDFIKGYKEEDDPSLIDLEKWDTTPKYPYKYEMTDKKLIMKKRMPIKFEEICYCNFELGSYKTGDGKD